MSTSAVSLTDMYHQEEQVAALKREMLNSASKRYLLIDHTKLNRRALHTFASMTDFDQVVVDALTPDSLITDLRERGVSVVRAEAAPN